MFEFGGEDRAIELFEDRRMELELSGPVDTDQSKVRIRDLESVGGAHSRTDGRNTGHRGLVESINVSQRNEIPKPHQELISDCFTYRHCAP